jgi:DNA-binding CsgD family transcriptional regulator
VRAADVWQQALKSSEHGPNATPRAVGSISPPPFRQTQFGATPIAPKVNEQPATDTLASPRDIFVALNYGLELVRYGAMLVAGEGRPQVANRAALTILNKQDGLLLANTGLVADRATDTRLLLKLLQDAIQSPEQGEPKESPVTLPRKNARSALIVRVVPGPGLDCWPNPDNRSALVMMYDQDLGLDVNVPMLSQIYGLTRGEAALAASLMRGKSIDEAADELFISPHTARTHLKRIFMKTDTHRQSELVVRIFPAVLWWKYPIWGITRLQLYRKVRYVEDCTMLAGNTRSFVGKPLLALALLAIFVPIVAHADSTLTFNNIDGIAGTSAPGVTGPFSLKSSGMTSNALGGITGTIAFTTGTTFTGSLATGGFWDSTGSSFTITAQGLGIVFQGSFTGNITWTLQSPNTCTQCVYTLSGGLAGTFYSNGISQGNGVAITNGGTTQLQLVVSGLYNGGKGVKIIEDQGGVTTMTVPTTVPEPGSLALMGTGLLGAGFVARRKVKSSS